MSEITRLDGVDLGRENIVDVTEDVEVYENGKAFSCECGQGIGVEMGREAIICASCGRMCVDTKNEEREPPTREQGQTSLGDW